MQRLDWLEKATAFQKSYNYGDAIEAYSKAIEVDPNHAAAYFNRAFLYTKLRKLDSALRDLRSAARLGYGKSQAPTAEPIVARMNPTRPDQASEDDCAMALLPAPQ